MYYEYDNGVVTDSLTLPIVELNGPDFSELTSILSLLSTATNQTVSGHMDSKGNYNIQQKKIKLCLIYSGLDPNPWEEVYNSNWMLTFTIIFGILSAVTFSLAIKELVVFIRKDGKLSFSIPQVCLISIAFGSICTSVVLIL